jgi:hypothetical protein
MALTKQDLDILSKPFPANVHKFTQGLAYIHEEPIAVRLDTVDPSWSWELVKIERRANAGQGGGKDVGTVWVHGRLTVGGVSRDGLGMAVIQQTNPIAETKWENGVSVKTGEFYTNEANEAEKSAATDAFKRAFRMFGGGRYLLAMPKENGKSTVTNIAQLDNWLKLTYGDIEAMPSYNDDFETEEMVSGNKGNKPQSKPATPASKPQVVAKPAPTTSQSKPWTKEDAEAFGVAWQRDGFSSGDILAILDVKRLGEWEGSLADADGLMRLAKVG